MEEIGTNWNFFQSSSSANYYNNSSLLFKTQQFCPISWVYSAVNLETVWTVTLGRMGSLSLIFKRRAISLKLREKIQFFGSGDLAEFEKYAPSKQTAKAVALCGDAKHQTPQPQGGFCCTPYYHLPNHQIQRTRGGFAF